MKKWLIQLVTETITSDFPHITAQQTAFCPPSISSQRVLRCVLKSETYKINPFFCFIR